MIWPNARTRVQEHADDAGKQSPEVGQDLADVMAAATKDRKAGVAKAARQRTA